MTPAINTGRPTLAARLVASLDELSTLREKARGLGITVAIEPINEQDSIVRRYTAVRQSIDKLNAAIATQTAPPQACGPRPGWIPEGFERVEHKGRVIHVRRS